MGDVTQQGDVDAIVTTLPTDLDVGSTLNQSIIQAAGHDLDNFLLENIFKPRPGDVFPVPAFHLPVSHIFYVMTPPWRDGFDREDRDLLRCYRHAIETAIKMDLRRIAFPALATGKRCGFPADRAARLAIQGILDRISPALEEVRIVCRKPEIYETFKRRLQRMGWRDSKAQSKP